uniref:MFS domain-containing protein n=1 Tax=Globodera pallida TaxID=36090 RepID=A0A183BZ76_GLOPA
MAGIVNIENISSQDEEHLENLLSKNEAKRKPSNERAPIFEIVSCAVGSSFQFGYHCGCINLPADLIRHWFAESYEQLYGMPISDAKMETTWAIAVSIFAVGGMIGGIFVGSLADRLGRRQALLYNNALALIAVSLMTAAKYVGIYWLFIIGRFVIGINAGLNSGLVPLYLTEISPTNLRGSVASIAQLAVTISILISQIVGLPFLFGTPERWPFIFAFAMKAGLVGQLPNYATILMGTVNVLMTIVSTYLIERLGRRTLHIAGLIGLAISTFIIAISMIVAKTIYWFSFVTIVFVLLMVVSVATGPGSIPWFYVNELFPMNARASANSVAVFTNWAANSLVATLFPMLEIFFMNIRSSFSQRGDGIEEKMKTLIK